MPGWLCPIISMFLFDSIDNWPMAKIVSSWKKFTARKIRGYLRKTDVGIKNADLKIGDPHRELNSEEAVRSADLKIGDPHRELNPEEDVASASLKTGDPGGEAAEKAGEQHKGPFWHREFWDRYIRDEEHYYDTIEYIHNNPVKARLVKKAEDWPWSSAGWGGRNSMVK